MAATALPFPVVDNMLKWLIEEGTHASLHTIVDICVNGVMGAANRVAMRAAITPVRKARMRAIYTTGHFASQRAVGAPAPAVIPLISAPLNATEFPLICRCTQCFAFLCKFDGGVITVSGFTEARRSYLYEALAIPGVDAPGVDVAVGIIQRLPEANLKLPQRYTALGGTPWPRNGYVFGIVASRERPTKAYMKRIHVVLVAMPPVNQVNYSLFLGRAQTVSMAPWIDVATAARLRSWNINFGILSSQTQGTMYHRVIVERNPHRYTLLPWMDLYANPGGVNCNTIMNTSLDPAGGTGWTWPPIGVAMYMGDIVAVRALASIPGIDFNPLTPVPGAAMVTVGVAGPYALTWNALSAFKEWLSHAGPLMKAAGQHGQITDILYAVIKTCSDKRVAINAEPLPAGTLITARRRSKKRRRQLALDVALSFIYTIQEETFSRVRATRHGTWVMVKMYETDWYRDWVTNFKRTNRVPATRTCRDVVSLINVLNRTTHHITRSERIASNLR